MTPYFHYPLLATNIGISKHLSGVMLYDVSQKKAKLLLKLTDLFSLPYSVYLLDSRGATVQINEVGARVCGFPSPTQAIGKTIFDVSTFDSIDLLDNCESVLKHESVKIFDESTIRHDGRLLNFLSIKFPCYDPNEQLQGTLGISIVLGEHSLAEAITRLNDLGLLSSTSLQPQKATLNLGSVVLSGREMECLEYTVKGFTAKEIAKQLTISPRTVEEYLNKLKSKLGVSSKQQLIQKILHAE